MRRDIPIGIHAAFFFAIAQVRARDASVDFFVKLSDTLFNNLFAYGIIKTIRKCSTAVQVATIRRIAYEVGDYFEKL